MSNRIWKIIFGFGLLLYIPIALAFVSSSRKNVVCNNVKISIQDSTNLQFISKSEISKLIRNHFKKIKGATLNDINLHEIENVVRKFPAVDDCKVYPTIDGTLCVVVEQRIPLLRVFENGGSYLLDNEGGKIPLRGTYKPRLVVVSGHVSALKDKTGLIDLTYYIEDDDFWDAQIEQVYVTTKGEFVLIPRIGNHQIVFGDGTDIDMKFRKLKALYEDGLDPLEWNSYKTINLKFKGQVICSKI